ISSDGRFLYANTRNVLNQIVVFSIDQESGKLTEIGRQAAGGLGSRTFTFAPGEKLLFVTNQKSDRIEVLSRNPETGLLRKTGKSLKIYQPSLVKFIPQILH